MAGVLYRRTEQGFGRQVLQGSQARLQLPELGIELALGEFYDGINPAT